MAGQSIRRSQFITTYGPGAILEGPNGPRVIPALDLGRIFTPEHPAINFEITDRRLSKALLGGAGIVRLPSNAELGVAETKEVYETFPFPSWALCTTHSLLYQGVQWQEGEVSPRTCPRCPRPADTAAAWRRVRNQAIRFVQICPAGHLDDVSWTRLITHRRPGCQPSALQWMGSGSALRNIEIRCPDCGEHVNLGWAYNRPWPCSGRQAERGSTRSSCSAEARIIQRGAANVRMAEIHSALTIPQADTRLHRLLETSMVLAVVTANRDITSRDELLEKLNALVQINLLGPAIVNELARYPEPELLAAIQQITTAPLPQDDQTLRHQEFEALRRAATVGAPPQPSSTPGSPPQFEVIQSEVREFTGPGGHQLRVTPMSRLRVVMVQRGYRRLDPLESSVVDVCYVDEGDRRWYPGTELYGEGIFVDLAPASLISGHHFPLRRDSSWLSAWRDPAQFRQRLQQASDRIRLHPVFVWWHTFAHRLVNALSIDSGYSSAAVRERVYLDVDEITGEAIGGILLYTAQPGGDGTLGGMIALVPRFDRVLRAALSTLDNCSNDPLCGEEEFRAGKYNGAACYACQLISETSCEHHNTRLDRMLLLENLP
jgi:hypothetical protein